MSETFVLQTNGTYQINKDPDAVLDYTFDFTDWLDLVSDTINTAVCSIVDSPTTGGAVNSSTIVGKKVVAWVSGGTPGKKIALRCRVTTNSSPARIDDRTVYLKVKER